jgi:hypothetical protein
MKTRTTPFSIRFAPLEKADVVKNDGDTHVHLVLAARHDIVALLVP